MSWYKRLQIEIAAYWQVFPGKLTIKEWAFSPNFKLMYPGKVIKSRGDYPEGGIKNSTCVDNVFYAEFYWLTCAIRILGLDLGAAIYYVVKKK